jgi:hypothetical protein
MFSPSAYDIPTQTMEINTATKNGPPFFILSPFRFGTVQFLHHHPDSILTKLPVSGQDNFSNAHPSKKFLLQNHIYGMFQVLYKAFYF